MQVDASRQVWLHSAVSPSIIGKEMTAPHSWRYLRANSWVPLASYEAFR
jgi:hypothetical protein